ncbi:MAG: hypothetical protein JSS66_17260 [Armatimonadetes bacterium]|nr:hypothetical protein [Armatimonadota bacterium]
MGRKVFRYSAPFLIHASVLGAVLAMGASASAQPLDPSLYSGLRWRNIGPFRGGRVSAVSGAIGQPGVFYMGLPMGGVWKTTSAGATWYPIFDEIKDASSVGAIEVAPSDPRVIYVGMGDMVAGGGISEGNGVYKSVDSGKTWQHMGLEQSKQIPSILVDPHDPNLVFVAAQGNLHERSDTRGLYRSSDGGKTWTKTLFVDNETGVQKIAWAFDNPSVMLATTVRHYVSGGGNGRGSGGGPAGPAGVSGGTKLFKSTDEGLTWTEVKGDGLPSLSGRTCVAIANGTRSQRMFLVANSGLYRSDDGGSTWRQMDRADRRVANGQGGYNCGIYVNTKDPDTLYLVNTSSYISHDGGETFTGFKGAPGGDDPQQLWLDPTDAQRLFFGTDQGATVSQDGGETWSSWYNQATAQVYHISVDNQFPYWVYATQQDSGCIATASRGNLGAVSVLDWLPHPGYEFGSIVADPLNPKVSYAGGPGGGIVKTTYPSGQWINVSPSLDSTERLRRVNNQPLAFSPVNPHELLAGFQYLMATTDGGAHWKKLSPDLGYPKGVTPPKPDSTTTAPRRGGNVEVSFGDEEEQEMEEQAQTAPGGSIESFSVSSVNGNTIWVGTNTGLVKVTKDHGKTWDDVTIPNLPNNGRADISAIDASHHDPATAYVAVDAHGSVDFAPYFYRTHDYGKSWTKIVAGLPTDLASGSFARVIRADTKKPGLLFAGTESFVYVSFDDGDNWQSLALNQPNTSYRDMVVHDNDLVVGTYGRGFWVLDDISPLRELTATFVSQPAYLFKPSDGIRVRRNVNGDTPFPPEVPHAVNPPAGVILYYYLGSAPQGDVTLEIADSSGKVVRHMSSAPMPPSSDPPPPVPDFWTEKPKPMPREAGMWRINWNLRMDNPQSFNHSYEINANPGETPLSPEGPLVAPGEYDLTLTVDGKAFKQKVTVRNDPRSPASASDLRAQNQLQMALYSGVQEAWEGFQQVTALKASVSEIVKSNAAADLTAAATAFETKLTALGGSNEGFRRGGGGGGGGAAAVPTFAGLVGSLNRMLSTLDSGDMAPSEPIRKASSTALAGLKTATTTWSTLKNQDLVALNALLAKHNMKPLSVN